MSLRDERHARCHHRRHCRCQLSTVTPPSALAAAASESGLSCVGFRIRFIEQALQYEWRDKRVHDSDLRMSSPDATCLQLPGYMRGLRRG